MPKVSEEHVAARRRQIVDAAVECFSRDGFHRATMQDIVAEAGLSPGAIYSYFASKDDIVEAIAAERHARERATIARAREAKDIGEGLRAVARAFFGALAEPDEQRRRRLWVQIWAEALRDPRMLATARRGIDEPRKLFAQAVREAQQRGELPAHVDPDAFGRLAISLFLGFVLQQAWDPRVELEPYVDVLEYALDAMVRR